MNLNKVIEELLAENQKLKQDLLRAEAMEDYWKIHSSELEEDITQLKEELNQSDYVKASIFSDREEYKQQIIELKTKLFDANVKEQRLLKILNETSDYT